MSSDSSLLLDTNILLAALIAPETLSAEVREALQDPRRTVYYSAASIWEIAIKYSLGREDFDFAPDNIQSLAEATGFVELPVRAAQAGAVAAMPWHHRDPFDRILIAQAQSLPAYLLTRDALLRHYSDLVQVV
jgi:PIN domain nuclease of toxin-antitoxin system